MPRVERRSFAQRVSSEGPRLRSPPPPLRSGRDFGHPYLVAFGQTEFGQTAFGQKKNFGGGPEGWGPGGVGAQNFAFFCLSPTRIFFLSFFSLLGSFRGILVAFEAPGPSNVHVWALWLSCEAPATKINEKTPRATEKERNGCGKFWAVRRRGVRQGRRLWPVSAVCALLCFGGPAGASQPENSKRAHLRVPALQMPPKFHERTPQREEKRAKFWVQCRSVQPRGRSGGGGGPGERPKNLEDTHQKS